jgi:hypothetical protein
MKYFTVAINAGEIRILGIRNTHNPKIKNLQSEYQKDKYEWTGLV